MSKGAGEGSRSDRRFSPWKTEVHRFTLDGLLITLHDTGQIYATRPPTHELAFYHEAGCHFQCVELAGLR
jgi:hypothetical protein